MERNKKYKDAVDTYYVYGGYNCAESVVLCARDLFHLNIAEKGYSSSQRLRRRYGMR